jgi:ferrochelatase
MSKKIAVILFNLGGPDSPAAVEPFLFNLFNDKAIITLPNPLRWFLAKLISSKRAPIARHIYALIGGKSPILEETKKQAEALEKRLGDNYKAFISMRYWHPFSDETIKNVIKYNPDEIILLPLYPQFSTSTTGSSLQDWKLQCSKYQLNTPTKTICCYPLAEKFIDLHAQLIKKSYSQIADKSKVRILFSAHGLPQKMIDAGDPYQYQIEQNASAIVQKLSIENLDWKVCYQSKVGRLKWLEPSTETEIITAAKQGISLIIVPIAFVSEHSETLVELDIEYKKMAEENGNIQYLRVPTLSIENSFIDSLADICENYGSVGKICAGSSLKCSKEFGKCGLLNN